MRLPILIAATLIAVPGAAQEVQRIAGGDVAVYNLVGHARVVRGSGSDVVVRVTRRGTDADRLQIQMGEIDGRQTLRVVYPASEIVYPELSRGSNSTRRVRADGTFGDGRGGRGEEVRIRGSGSGLEAWADLVVEVPEGDRISIYVGLGEVEADGVHGDVLLDVGSGRATATDIVGSLVVDTGSGAVMVRGVTGDTRIDTGSGRVGLSEVTGEEVSVDTGSGRVTGEAISVSTLEIDTGSGRIELEAVSARDVRLDTGSGSIDFELLSDVDRLAVDTGSGSVTIRAPADLGATVDLDTGSGGVDVDFPVEVQSVRRDALRGRIGDGDGTIEIETGSGSIHLLRSAN